MKDTYILKLDLNYFEFLSAFLYQALRMKLIQRLIVYFIIASILMNAWVAITLDLVSFFSTFFLYVFITCFCLLIVLMIAGILLMLLRRRSFRNVVYRFTHWGMEKTGSNIEFSIQWNKILKMKESSHFIFLYVNANDAHVIQKRMFDSFEELQEFKQFVSQRLNSL